MSRYSSTVRTLLCPGETGDYGRLAVNGTTLTGVDGRT